MLEVKDLHVNYGAVHALNGISLHVDDGEIVSLIGANGAGKTTTLRTITGLEKAASSSVMFDGHDLRKAEPSKIITYKLAHVPEGRHIFPQMTVEENLEMGAYADPAGMEETMKDVYKRSCWWNRTQRWRWPSRTAPMCWKPATSALRATPRIC